MILVTGASGKTGIAIIRSLSAKKLPVRALIHKLEYRDVVFSVGANEVLLGNIENINDLQNAVRDVETIYHICPNMHQNEFEIGNLIINVSKQAGCHHFVYHSVLHPQIKCMPHHWQKLLVEERLLESGLAFSILQPTAYMQNILGYLPNILKGYYELPYPPTTKISLVDLEDVADAVSEVVINHAHNNAIYELVGTEPLSQLDVAHALSQHLKRNVQVGEIDLCSWERSARASGLNEYSLNTLTSMFKYYSNNGLCGNPNILTWLIKRNPKTIQEFIFKNIKPD